MPSAFEMREVLQRQYPNTHNALTWLVPAMEKVERGLGRRRFLFFGADKGLIAYEETFLPALGIAISSMHDDGMLPNPMSRNAVKAHLVEALDWFALAYPNWPDAYAFAKTFFSRVANPDLDALITEVSAGIASKR